MKAGVSMTSRWSSSGSVAIPWSATNARAASMLARYSPSDSANEEAWSFLTASSTSAGDAPGSIWEPRASRAAFSAPSSSSPTARIASPSAPSSRSLSISSKRSGPAAQSASARGRTSLVSQAAWSSRAAFVASDAAFSCPTRASPAPSEAAAAPMMSRKPGSWRVDSRSSSTHSRTGSTTRSRDSRR